MIKQANNTETVADTLIGPEVSGLGYKHIIKTVPTTGEVIDAELYIYAVTDTKSDSISGREVRYYEAVIEERVTQNSVDSDRLPLRVEFEITEDIVKDPSSLYESLVYGSGIDVPQDVGMIHGADLLYYSAALHEYSDIVASYIGKLNASAVFDFDRETYNSNVYDISDLMTEIEKVKVELASKGVVA